MSVLLKATRGMCGAAMLFSLSACTMIGPDFETPTSEVSQQWLEESDERVKTDPADYSTWWKALDDPVLDQLIERAFRQNLPLKIAGVRVAEARALLGVSVGNLYPQVQQASGSVSYTRTSERDPAAPQPGTVRGFDHAFSMTDLGVGASWEIDFWGRFRRAVQSAEAEFFSSIANYDNVLVSLTADVALNYVIYRSFEERIEIARQNLETQRESLRIARARYQEGETGERDVQQALTQLHSTEAAVPVLEVGMRKARNALGVLLGMPPAEMREVLTGVGDIPEAPLEVAVGIPADLLRRRPDVRQAELQAAAQSALIGVAKADLYPAFSLTGNFGFLASDVGSFDLADISEWKSRTGSIGPSFQWNLFNYGRITNNVRVQDARLQELLLNYQQTVLRAQQEVEDGLVAFLRTQEEVNLRSKSVEAAKRSVELAMIQYTEGITDYTTVLTALQALLNQQDLLALTRADVPQGLIAVYRALGGGWELREGVDFITPEIREEMENRTNWGDLLTTETPGVAEPEPSTTAIRKPDW